MLNFLEYLTELHKSSDPPPTMFILEITKLFNGSSLHFFVAQGMSLAFSHGDFSLKMLLCLNLTPSALPSSLGHTQRLMGPFYHT